MNPYAYDWTRHDFNAVPYRRALNSDVYYEQRIKDERLSRSVPAGVFAAILIVVAIVLIFVVADMNFADHPVIGAVAVAMGVLGLYFVGVSWKNAVFNYDEKFIDSIDHADVMYREEHEKLIGQLRDTDSSDAYIDKKIAMHRNDWMTKKI